MKAAQQRTVKSGDLGARRVAAAWLRALRPHQWAKNLLVFAPLAIGHKLGQTDLLLPAFSAFLVMCAASSAAYLLNDLRDLQADRAHWSKRNRPLASGDLSPSAGYMGAGLLFLLALAGAAPQGLSVTFLIVLYLAGTCLYSLGLKKVLALDVVMLAGLYCLRLLLGGAATGIPISPWTLSFFVFIFLDLALMKRYTELFHLRRQELLAAERRGYRVTDMPQLASLGSASGFTAVLVIALYVNSDEVMALYRHPLVLWSICAIVLLWHLRMWLITNRGDLHEDPVLYSLRDPWSLGLAGLSGLIILLAS